MNKMSIVYVLVFAVAAFAGYSWYTKNSSTQPEQAMLETGQEMTQEMETEEQFEQMPMQEEPAMPAVEDEKKMITPEEFAKHNSKEDCWVHFQGKVYDVTAWLSKHPGGADKIAQFCGKDGFEEAFTKKHKMGKVEKMYQETTYIGELAK